ncbi:MAG: RNase adapter RapZ [Desulfovibrionaceae bacterium]|nr:RNase adapter RapZ [Desulfovibrionaceae bacterium]
MIKSKTFPLIIVAGLSGAGKSTVLHVFEDMGYFTVDGLPAELVADMLNVLNKQSLCRYNGLVMGVDTREPNYLAQLDRAFEKIDPLGFKPFILFMEAGPEALVRRYATTRRPHPLERDGFNLEQAMLEEKQRLAALRDMADLVIDTSKYNIHDLRRSIQNKWNNLQNQEGLRLLRVNLISFGFKYGLPAETEMAFDLRFLPNPYFVPELREFTGCDRQIFEYVLGNEEGKKFYHMLEGFILDTLPMLEAEGRFRVSIAIGCTGGKHRSVAFAEALNNALTKAGYLVTLEHRHMTLG